MKSNREFSVSELLLLVMFIGVWLAITIQLRALSVPFWGIAIVMVGVLRPAHQRRSTPQLATDVLSVAVSWALAGGVIGLVVDWRLSATSFPAYFSWSLIGELTGFYLGLLWVLVVLMARYVERVLGRVRRPRPVA